MKRVLVVAPHPDDETLGCGGTLLRHQDQGDEIHWLIMTGATESIGFSPERIKIREQEIKKVNESYRFKSTHSLMLPATQLDSLPLGQIIERVSKVIADIKPEILYLPFSGDAHSDHRVTVEVISSCTKWFRYPSIKRVLAYETISETDAALPTVYQGFQPNVFVNIEKYLSKKIEIMKMYASEMGEFPFPRSETAIQSLAQWRGSNCGSRAAEAFMLLKENL